MARKSNLENGFLFLYDWLPAFEKLPSKEFKALLLALIARQRENKPMPVFSNPSTAIYAGMIEPCIKRRLDGAVGKASQKKTPNAPPDGGVGGGVGGGVPPSPPKKSKEKQSKEKQSICIAERSEATAAVGGVTGTAAGGADGATPRADTKKKNFYGYKKEGGSPYGRKRSASSSFSSSFDIDEFFEAALARTYGDKSFDGESK